MHGNDSKEFHFGGETHAMCGHKATVGGEGAGGRCAPSCVECEAKNALINSKIILRSIF